MTTKDKIKNQINRVAETHFFLKPVLVNALKNQIITEEERKFTNGADNYYEYWTATFNDRFYDMATLIRLGTEIENGLKYYYMEKMGHQNLLDLKNDPNYENNIFQRILPWTKNSAIDLFITYLNYDLNNNTKLRIIQELMLCRHLYAHNTGLINDDFVNKYYRLTGIDIAQIAQIKNSYPQNDTYFFTPLNKINEYIEESKRFISELP